MDAERELPPQAVIIAGPNGSGKSTCAGWLLPPTTTFINADRIAQELSGEPGTAADMRAGRVLLDRLEHLEAERRDFAVETTLATKKLATRLARLQSVGYEIHLVFLWLPSDDLAVERVAERVRAGGHAVPEETIRRRFQSGLRLFFSTYRPLADLWRMYDNSTLDEPRLIAYGQKNGAQQASQSELWGRIRQFGETMEATRQTGAPAIR